MSEALLEAKGISHGFEYTLFDDVDFVLKATESAAIVGRSGSGKSTLLHIVSTFLTPNEGSVKLLNKELYALKESEIEEMRRYEIGIIFQFHYLFKGMSAMENVNVATMLSGEEIDENLLEKLEIKEVMDHKIGDLSGGQQQRVSIARVLSKKPRVIFADEPTGNLDKETANLVMDVLLEYTKHNDAALLLVTHDNEMASRCDKTYRLEEKQLKEYA
ncbi:ABC transporter ATP-binding protein [Sulfurovum sp. zt1-1]|uniref:ABC transporter ATP-binding protein n=1 Tax=Sulfurovum zhangzhouensis TaxID=3019067 RepID=A0ABT7QZH6_9BACT|nr:ABC transporter ATP-binding protein [Sulfurovum zhangzhouensis]MDM5272239.1 ABC transporter ATP-binding protein [Sulfurovum zhangzhouensis]